MCWVDDCFYHGSSKAVQAFEDEMTKQWGHCKQRDADFLLGLNIRQDAHGIHISVEKSIQELITELNLNGTNPTLTPLPPGTAIDAREHSADEDIGKEYCKAARTILFMVEPDGKA